MNAVMESIRKIRSIRAYEPKPVSRDLLDPILLGYPQAEPPRPPKKGPKVKWV